MEIITVELLHLIPRGSYRGHPKSERPKWAKAFDDKYHPHYGMNQNLVANNHRKTWVLRGLSSSKKLNSSPLPNSLHINGLAALGGPATDLPWPEATLPPPPKNASGRWVLLGVRPKSPGMKLPCYRPRVSSFCLCGFRSVTDLTKWGRRNARQNTAKNRGILQAIGFTLRVSSRAIENHAEKFDDLPELNLHLASGDLR